MGRTSKSPGERLSDYRRDQKLTQDDLAEMLDVTEGFVSKLERGRKQPSGALAARIEGIAGIPAADWFSVDEDNAAA